MRNDFIFPSILNVLVVISYIHFFVAWILTNFKRSSRAKSVCSTYHPEISRTQNLVKSFFLSFSWDFLNNGNIEHNISVLSNLGLIEKWNKPNTNTKIPIEYRHRGHSLQSFLRTEDWPIFGWNFEQWNKLYFIGLKIQSESTKVGRQLYICHDYPI